MLVNGFSVLVNSHLDDVITHAVGLMICGDVDGSVVCIISAAPMAFTYYWWWLWKVVEVVDWRSGVWRWKWEIANDEIKIGAKKEQNQGLTHFFQEGGHPSKFY